MFNAGIVTFEYWLSFLTYWLFQQHWSFQAVNASASDWDFTKILLQTIAEIRQVSSGLKQV